MYSNGNSEGNSDPNQNERTKYALNGQKIDLTPQGPIEEYNIGFLDPINKKIITLLENNVLLSQTEIAKKLGLSQSSIALRLDKLLKSGILRETAGIQLKSLGLEMSRADVSCADPGALLEWASKCPLFINGSIGIGGNNVSLYFTAEDVMMFQYILDEHVRRLAGVSEVHFSPIISWAKDYIVPVKLDLPTTQVPPCGMLPYCPRCPANPNYNGKIWSNNGKK